MTTEQQKIEILQEMKENELEDEYYMPLNIQSESIHTFLQHLEESKKKKEELLNKQKEVIPDTFYLVHYRVKENGVKIEGGLSGLFHSKYLAINACELIENSLNDKYDDDNITIRVKYSEFKLNHIKYINL